MAEGEMRGHWLASAALVIALGVAGAAAAEKKYDPGVSDTEITIGQTMIYSGPYSVYDQAGKALVGLITAYYAKSPEFRRLRDDSAMREYFAWAKEWFPGGNAEDGIVAYGYQVAQALEYVLRRCGDELTRANVMRVATHMDHVAFPMLLPGITATTSPTDYFPIKQFQMFRFDGKEWVPFGPLRGPE
jgi:hypothetical protein